MARTATTGRLRRTPVRSPTTCTSEGSSIRPVAAVAGTGTPSAASMVASRRAGAKLA